MEFWFVRSRGLCAKCGKKNCPGIKPQGSCGATKLQIHKFQNDELLNLVKRHADNANANADDQGVLKLATVKPAKGAPGPTWWAE